MKPDHTDVTGSCCTVADVLARKGDRRTVNTVRLLAGGPTRFSQIRREVSGIS